MLFHESLESARGNVDRLHPEHILLRVKALLERKLDLRARASKRFRAAEGRKPEVIIGPPVGMDESWT